MDNNCNGVIAEEEQDNDFDGYTACDGDCDDTSAQRYPGAPEYCDGVDNNCNGVVPADEVDSDGDGFMVCNNDCDDGDADIHPGATELCNGVDDDCNGSLSATETDVDGDGYAACEGDCMEGNAAVYPGAPEVCDPVDNDCDGDLTTPCATCLEALQSGAALVDGQYTLNLDGVGGFSPLTAECDMTTDGGGWTMIMATVDDWSDSGDLVTDYTDFWITNHGSINGAYRMAGRLWEGMSSTGDLLVAVTPRETNGAACADTLYYTARNLTLDVPETGPATVSGYYQSAELIGDGTFSTTDSGPAQTCVNDESAVPWFLGSCGATCPTLDAGWADPAPAMEFLDTTADIYGSTAGDVCSAVDQAGGYEAATEMKIYLR